MRWALVVVAAVLILAIGGWWFMTSDAQDSNAYTAVAEMNGTDVKRCGIDYLARLGKDDAGHDLAFKVSAATEMVEDKTPIVFFAVTGLRLTHGDSGEKLKIADAAVEAGELKTRGSSMFRPKGGGDSFIETSISQDEMLTLPLAMMNGSTLSLRLAGEQRDRVYTLPRAADAPWQKVSACFKRLHKQLETAEQGEKQKP